MMKTDKPKKVVIRIEPESEQENVRSTRRGLKTIQPAGTDKENLTGRPQSIKDSKLGYKENEQKKQKPLLMHKGTQTEKYITNIEDLTGEEASVDYWRTLAEKRQESLDESLQEIDKLKEHIGTLQEENKICKDMLEESKTLVEVLKEMLNEDDNEEETLEKESDTPEKDDSGNAST